jgi:hypothetical protein
MLIMKPTHILGGEGGGVFPGLCKFYLFLQMKTAMVFRDQGRTEGLCQITIIAIME